MIKITKIKAKHTKYFYIVITLFKLLTISIGTLGIKKFDIRFQISWGWDK